MMPSLITFRFSLPLPTSHFSLIVFHSSLNMNERIREYLKHELTEFSIAFIDERKKVLRAQKLPIDGDLLQSFEREIQAQSQDEAIRLSIAFLDSGRFIDMKPETIAHDKWGRNYIERLEEWINSIGVEKFVYGFLDKPGRTFKLGSGGYSSLINSMAWGIAKARTKGKFRRKQWWNKDKTRATFRLVNTLAANMPDVVADTVLESFSPSSKKTPPNFSANKYNKARGR
jgi:hypothetical protein